MGRTSPLITPDVPSSDRLLAQEAHLGGEARSSTPFGAGHNTLTLTPLRFTRLVGGRSGADSSAVVVSGDQALRTPLAERLGFTS